MLLTCTGLAVVLTASPAQADNHQITICHAAGQAGTDQFVTLTISENAVYGPGGHFNENGTPRAGHEQDYLGACTAEAPPEQCPEGQVGTPPNCQAPAAEMVTVCHLLGNGSYQELTFAAEALPAHLGHGDIHPVPVNGCPPPPAECPDGDLNGDAPGCGTPPPPPAECPDGDLNGDEPGCGTVGGVVDPNPDTGPDGDVGGVVTTTEVEHRFRCGAAIRIERVYENGELADVDRTVTPTGENCSPAEKRIPAAVWEREHVEETGL
ncbi:hypothetical protein [Nocardioides sp. SYSU DS0651]|uniref:hypothetical protein n=1 Tax=Nocardioides sp. SYSU DS0651 TaxID=3415955 RepID=UPI003F4C97DA